MSVLVTFKGINIENMDPDKNNRSSADDLHAIDVAISKMSCLSIEDNAINMRTHALKKHLKHIIVDHKTNIMNEPTLKDAHVYCVINCLSAQKFGPLLENYIIQKFGYRKNSAKDCIGDCNKDDKNIEVKTSLGGASHDRFNFVQLRPSHNISHYMLTAYHLNEVNVDNHGDLYIFQVPKNDMMNVLVEFGTYAHGTKNEHKEITKESLLDPTSRKEYALRMTYNDKCWKRLMIYQIEESSM